MDVVIVGAGVTGLTAGISLRRTGHRVTIFERSALNNEVGAAINVPPNVGRFLLPWGLDPIRARFVSSKGMYFVSHSTFDEQSFHDHSRNTALFGAPLYYAHRVDLHESLKRLATDPDGPGVPVKIHLKSEATGYDSDTPSITLSSGTVIAADLVIAADGVHSVAVEAVLGKPNPPQPANHANCSYRFLIPTAELDADPETRFFVHGPQALGARIFAHPEGQRRIVSYPCRDYEVINFIGICVDKDFISKREDWHASVDKSKLLKAFEGFHPGLIAVMKKAKDIKRWPLLYRPPVPTWHRGKMALAGDAAHPMLPHHGQGGAQGMEDGLAIGLVFCSLADRSQIEERLAIYEKVRRNRASSIQMLSNFGFDEAVDGGVADYLEGTAVPKNAGDMIKLAYEPDVVQRTVQLMTEFDPSFKVPEGFFATEF